MCKSKDSKGIGIKVHTIFTILSLPILTGFKAYWGHMRFTFCGHYVNCKYILSILEINFWI